MTIRRLLWWLGAALALPVVVALALPLAALLVFPLVLSQRVYARMLNSPTPDGGEWDDDE